jgi:hypothetical protein
MLQDLIQLIERYEPGYSQTIRGASLEEIQRLEQLTGRSLPACYREFLLLMGKDMAGLQIAGLSFCIDQIIDFYASGDWIPPKEYLLFGIQGEDPYLDYYLECTEPEPRDCPVVRFPSEGEFSKKEYFYPLDPSLKDFLLSLAFSAKRMEVFDVERVFTPSTRRSKKEAAVSVPSEIARLVDERAHHLGFERVAPSSTAYRFYDHEQAAIYVRFDEANDNLSVTLACRKASDLERMGDILCHGTSLVTT